MPENLSFLSDFFSKNAEFVAKTHSGKFTGKSELSSNRDLLCCKSAAALSVGVQSGICAVRWEIASFRPAY